MPGSRPTRPRMQSAKEHADNEMNSDRMMELCDYKLGVDGRLMKAEYKRLSVEEEQGVYDMNARLMLEKQARRRAENSGTTLERDQYIASDMVLHTLEAEKSRQSRQRRIDIEEFNKGLAQQKRDFDAVEKKAYRHQDHVEVYTSTANVA